MKIIVRVKGSAYSGNFDHAGIPGHQGGSLGVSQANKYASPAEQYSIKRYCAGGYSQINRYLREGFSVSETELTATKDYITNIDRVMPDPKSVIKNPITVSRDFGYSMEAKLKEMQVGDSFVDNGFTSTSRDLKHGSIKIRVPAGIRAILPGDLSFYEKEKELILNRGLRYTIVDNTPGNIILEVSE